MAGMAGLLKGWVDIALPRPRPLPNADNPAENVLGAWLGAGTTSVDLRLSSS